MRICKRCKEEKPDLDFIKLTDLGRESFNKICTQCYKKTRNPYQQRNSHLLQYGMDHFGYEMLLLRQDGVCAGCLRSPNPGEHFHVDHIHPNGPVRGLLCERCNHCLGHAKDNPGTLKRLADYLEKHHAKESRTIQVQEDEGASV